MQTATARKKTSRKPPPVACEQTTIRTTVADRTIALTGDRTRLVRVVIAPGSPSGKTPPEPLRLAMALPVAEYTRKLPNGTSVTAQQRIAWKRVGGSAREGVVVDGSAAHAAVIAACAEYEIEVHQHAAEPEGRFVILRDAVLMRLPPDAPDSAVFDQRAVETMGIPVMGRRGGKWVRWRGGIVAKIKPQYLCDLFTRAVPRVEPAPPPVEQPESPEVRVWISEREWDRLDAETRTEFEEPIGGSGVDWEGREGWVTALVPDDEVLVALRGIAEGAEVKLCEGEEMPAAPVKAVRGRKAKAPPSVAGAPVAVPEAATHRSQALKSLVTLAVSDKIRSGCEIAFDKAAGEMLIAARSEMGSQEARVPAETTGEVPKFGMSRNLLTAALDACASKRVRIGMGRELDPFLFTSDERPDFAAVVMPQRI